MRLRKINDAIEELRRSDPGSALTKSALRRMVTTGAIPSVRVGQKYLLDVDQLEELFSRGTKPQTAPLPEAVEGIRRIERIEVGR